MKQKIITQLLTLLTAIQKTQLYQSDQQLKKSHNSGN